MTEQRKRKKTSRAVRASRGKALVGVAVTAAILFYGAYLFFTVTGMRFGTHNRLVPSLLCGILFCLGTFLAVSAFRKETAFRQLFVVLNLVGGLYGVFWVGLRLVQGSTSVWLALDAAGIAVAGLICWVFFYSRRARTFFEEQEFTVKRY